jgi:hypothetical protein
MNGLDAMALTIAWREGPLRPPNRNFRNCNPGNLRSPRAPAHDTGGYDVYPDFVSGYQALLADLAAKFTDGKNAHGLGQSSTLLELMKIYAPWEDANNPASYAAFIAEWLGLALGRPISVQSKLSEIWTPPSAAEG